MAGKERRTIISVIPDQVTWSHEVLFVQPVQQDEDEPQADVVRIPLARPQYANLFHEPPSDAADGFEDSEFDSYEIRATRPQFPRRSRQGYRPNRSRAS